MTAQAKRDEIAPRCLRVYQVRAALEEQGMGLEPSNFEYPAGYQMPAPKKHSAGGASARCTSFP